MKASVKAKYDVEKKNAASIATFSMKAAGDSKLKLSLTDATFLNGPSLDGLSLALEKPGHLILNCSLPSKDWRFQFMNTIKVLEKPVKLTYIHNLGSNRTTMDGTVTMDPANKLAASYAFGSGDCKLRYVYSHGEDGRTTFEPSLDAKKMQWDFAASRRLEGDDVVRATYRTATQDLSLEWSRDSVKYGNFKLAASLNLGEELKIPKVTAETTWNYDM